MISPISLRRSNRTGTFTRKWSKYVCWKTRKLNCRRIFSSRVCYSRIFKLSWQKPFIVDMKHVLVFSFKLSIVYMHLPSRLILYKHVSLRFSGSHRISFLRSTSIIDRLSSASRAVSQRRIFSDNIPRQSIYLIDFLYLAAENMSTMLESIYSISCSQRTD